VVGGEIGKALLRYDEWKAELVEVEEKYDDACEAVEDDLSAELYDDMQELIRECFMAAETVIGLCRMHGILPA
jgi:hypothetical protein